MAIMQKKVTDLRVDLLKVILTIVAKSSKGAADLARALSVCRVFMNVADDKDVLRAVNFNSVVLSDRYELFQNANGLLNRCAQAGNYTAMYMLAKIILISSSQLFLRRLQNEVIRDHACCSAVSEKQAIAASFMAHFMADRACSSNVSHGSLLHYELVRLFLDCCSPQDLAEMRSDLEKYFGYFIGLDEGGYLGFFENIDGMCMFKCVLGCFENLEKDKRELEYPLPESERASNAEIFDMAERLDTSIGQYTVQNAFKEELSKQRGEAYDESISLSGSELEEMKAACRVLTVQFEKFQEQAISTFDHFFPPR